jgi:hypothetical protein
MNICYVCENPFDGEEIKRHEEHVIPNAIGGRLTSYEFLCEGCGVDLADSIDTPFNDHLQVFSVLHGISRDRGVSKKAAIEVISRVMPQGGGKAPTYSLNSDFTVIPDRPIYFVNEEERRVSVCCSVPKKAKVFMRNPELSKLKAQGYEVVLESDMTQFLVQGSLRINHESTVVLRGVAKIAIEYALHCGIDFSRMRAFKADLIDSCDEEVLRSAVVQYYPTTNEEKLYETGKFRHEDWYPNHQLFLFSDGPDLYCYVELFGAIQKYVHLSANFVGRLEVQKYLQRVKSWNFDPSDWYGGPKDLHMFAGQFGIPFTGRPLEDVQKDVLHQAEIRAYEIDADAQIDKVRNLVQLLVQFVVSDIPAGFPSVDDLLRKAADAKSGLGFTLVDRLKHDMKYALQWVHADFSQFRIQSEGAAAPRLAGRVTPEERHKYAAFRLYESLCSIGRENEIVFLSE